MTKNKIISILSLTLVIITGYLLISQSTVLTQTFFKDNTFPAGTFITWTGLLCLQLSVYYGFPKIQNSKNLFYMVIGYLIIITISLAFFYGIIAYALSGNWAFNFTSSEDFRGSDDASFWFWRLNYFLVIIPVISTISILIYELFLKLNTSKH